MRDHTGKPAAGIIAFVGTIRVEELPAIYSDEDGRYNLENLKAGRYFVVLTGTEPEVGCETAIEFVLAEGEHRTAVDGALLRPGKISG